MVQREPRSAPPEMTLGSTPGRGILRGRFQGISLETDRICPEPLQTASPRPSGQPSGQPSGSSRHSCREALRTAVRKVSAQLSGSPPDSCREALRTAVGELSAQLSGSSPHNCREALRRRCLGQLSGTAPRQLSGTARRQLSGTAIWAAPRQLSGTAPRQLSGSSVSRGVSRENRGFSLETPLKMPHLKMLKSETNPKGFSPHHRNSFPGAAVVRREPLRVDAQTTGVRSPGPAF